MSDSSEESNVINLRDPEVVDKFKVAANIVNDVIAVVVKSCVPGAKISEICAAGDRLIIEKATKVYNKGKIEKGVAFPTCLSVNHIVAHFSPLPSESPILAEGDVVKIDLGAHVDGYIVTGGHTTICTANPAQVVTGRAADAVCAAHFAAEAALRLLRPGKKNSDITEAIAAIAKVFNCNPIDTVLSHQLERFNLDGKKTIAAKAVAEHPIEEATFEEGEVYAIDISISTGEGKAKEGEARTTVFKRDVDKSYSLKIKKSRQFLGEVSQKFPSLPFSLGSFDEKVARFGVVECVEHELLQPYPVILEKKGEFVAQYKFTALILPSNINKLTSHALPFVQSTFTITDPKITAILALGTKRKAKSKKKKKLASDLTGTTKAATESKDDSMDTA